MGCRSVCEFGGRTPENRGQAETTNLQWPRDLKHRRAKERHSKSVSVVMLEVGMMARGSGGFKSRRDEQGQRTRGSGLGADVGSLLVDGVGSGSVGHDERRVL